MKKNLQIIKAIIAVSAVFLLTSAAETVIFLSGIGVREKYALAVLILSLATALVFPVLKELENTAYDKGYAAAGEQNILLERKTDELSRALKISEQSIKNLKETEPEYRHKCDVLENFRNSFPLSVQPGYTVFNIIRTEIVPDKYSRWLIVGEFGDELWCTAVIRRDMQTYGEMLSLIKATETPDGITALNEHNAFPWE